ncbi:molybdate ABC transporter substrate-binding protein [Microbacterium sp. BG28]|uniref:molybdate ABC transporter substrate-binding protein n=1 Tax=Microbacterium sp. BG28 TaxID=3097356 RepID=UPI002A59ECEB|nr:molybdate ABC transporter substrate-binding protein [Microbacterium sp. BG28]MDY0827653.1 molybdate ABC transporter substrate-binding protein [Microbacterium sp. BG28]
MPARRLSLIGLVVAGCLLLAGCAGTAEPTPAPSASGAAELTGTLTISAAASLSAAFDEIAQGFEAEHPGVQIPPISYDGSSTLATQIIGGAPVDVFASADENNMNKVVDAGLAGDPQVFATNTLVIAVPRGNPAGIASLGDLAKPGATVVLCAPEVPCGAASQKLLSAAGVTVTPVSQEQNVTAVLTKVAAGEADAGLVYATDVKGRDDVDSLTPDGAGAVVNRYPIAVLKDAPDAAVAAAFVAYVRGERGQAVLAAHGFGAP